jgi:hypothetical protein
VPAAAWNFRSRQAFEFLSITKKDKAMGKGILLWLLGIPLPIIILLALLWH